MSKFAALTLLMLMFAGCSVYGPPGTESSDDGSSLGVDYVRPEVRTPGMYENAPAEYFPLLDILYEYAYIFSGDNIPENINYEYYMNAVGFIETAYQPEKLSYAVVDINSDGVLEIVFGNSYLYTIWTLSDGKPEWLISFYSRGKGEIAADGTVYIVCGSGTAGTTIASYILLPNATELTKLTEYEHGNPGQNTEYFIERIDGKERDITKKEYYRLNEIYNNPTNLIELKWSKIL